MTLDLDHIVDKNRVKGPVSKVDLCKRQNQQLVLQWLDEGKVDSAMLPPPCGTSSRAREIPIIDKKGCRRPATRPLRSQNWPDGVPSLKGLDAMKVRLANSCIDLQGGSLTCVVSLEFYYLRESSAFMDVGDVVFSVVTFSLQISVHSQLHVWWSQA